MKRVLIDSDRPEAAIIRQAADQVLSGGIVAYPTDTLYGLGVDPRNAAAVAGLFALKGRSADAAIPLIAADVEQIERHVGALTPLARRLGAEFWPGPLTLVIDARPSIVSAVHAGTRSVAVRVPDHPVARALAAQVGCAITATSANRTAEPAARSADDVQRAFADGDLWVLDSGALARSSPSTMVDARGADPVLLRAGAVSWSRVLEFLSS